MQDKSDYSWLNKGCYTQEEAWTELGISRSTWYKLKNKHDIKIIEGNGVDIKRVAREEIIRVHKIIYKKSSVPPCEPKHLKESRERKKKSKD